MPHTSSMKKPGLIINGKDNKIQTKIVKKKYIQQTSGYQLICYREKAQVMNTKKLIMLIMFNRLHDDHLANTILS